MMWHSIKNKPTKEGIYVVAEFRDDELVSYSTDYALIEGYFGPNNIGYSERFTVTHWMTYGEYRKVLEGIEKE